MAERYQFTKDRLEYMLQTQANRAAHAIQLSARIQSYGGADEAIKAIAQHVR